MRNTVLATAVAATLALAAPAAFAQAKGAATKADVQAMQAQMEALAQRLSKLEATNATLQAENADLKSVVDRRDAEMDYLKAQTRELREEGAVVSNEVSKVKGADWATKIKFKGDLRYRHEMIARTGSRPGPSTDAADQTRHRIRARFGFDAKVTDNSKVVVQLATGGDDPRSSNQTLGANSTRKSIGLDLGYAEYTFMPGGVLTLGKIKNPIWRPGQSLFYDGDFNPEGGAVTFDRGMLFGGAYGMVAQRAVQRRTRLARITTRMSSVCRRASSSRCSAARPDSQRTTGIAELARTSRRSTTTMRMATRRSRFPGISSRVRRCATS